MNVILLRNAYPGDPLNGNDLRLWHFLQPTVNQVAVIAGKREEPKGERLNWPGSFKLAADLSAIPFGRGNTAQGHLRKYGAVFGQVLEMVEKAGGEWGGADAPAILASGHMAALALCAGKRPFVFELCDSMGVYFYRRWEGLKWRHPLKAANAWWMSRVYRNLELFISRHAAAITVASTVDAEFLEKHGAACEVTAIINGTDWVEAEAAHPEAEGCSVVFHGNMGWEPNRVAAVYLAAEVMPRLRQLVPEATLQIAGGPIFEELKRWDGQNGVTALGRVDDIRGALAKEQVYAMPMFQGSGFKNKLAEAMALGLPVVTNAMGAEAIDAEGRALVVCAETPEAIAQALGELLRNSAKRGEMGRRVRDYARAHFGWEARRVQLRGILEKAAKARG